MEIFIILFNWDGIKKTSDIFYKKRKYNNKYPYKNYK